MTTNPLRADELRELIGTAVRNYGYEGRRMEHTPLKQATRRARLKEAEHRAVDEILELLTPPPSLASVVAEIDAAYHEKEMADSAMNPLNDGEADPHYALWAHNEAAEKLVTNWPSIRTALTISGTGWRPEVRAFADLMEAQLRKNDHKPGWKHDRPHLLLKRLYDEAAELGHAMPYDDDYEAEIVGLEAADVANFAMMIADVCGALPQPKTGEG